KNKVNGLVNEKSPYLLQHAHNPVAWYPWSDEAFEKAQKEDKPIFLSVGYSTCHWCHVMARESFENEQIAALLNRWFVSIKVDREERPDIDQLYMTAVRLLTGGGGWPMSVFLCPDGRPFYGGTYFPPRATGGRPGFAEIITAIHRAWGKKHGELKTTAGAVMQALEEASGKENEKLEEELSSKAYAQLVKDFDAKYGGFGKAPKFPSPGNLNFLLNYWYHAGEKQALDMVFTTLMSMGAGGMFDHLGGGFHRYSVDSRWFLPHFEKMIYDQSLLVCVYLDAYLVGKDEAFSQTARQTLDYMLRDMRHPEGGVYSAEDADSIDPHGSGEKSEGAYYVWTEEEIVKAIGTKAANVFCYCYGVEFEGNVANDTLDEFRGKNILSLVHNEERAAEKLNLDLQESTAILADSRKLLYKKRLERVRPHLDDKIITAWNGLVLRAFTKAAAIFSDTSLLQAAEDCADFIWNNLYDQASKRLWRRYREGSVGVDGQLDDYVFLIAGLLELYFVTQDVKWLDWALTLSETQNKLFWDDMQFGFFGVAPDSDVLIRLKGDHDGAEPAANSVAVSNLLKLSAITGDVRWRDKATRTVEYFSNTLNSYPSMLLQMLCSYEQLHGTHSQVIIAGDRDAEDTREMMATVFSSFQPDLIVLLADGAENQQRLSEFQPFIAELKPTDGRATAYVCRDFTCNEPITDPERLHSVLASR
ncbi:MAG: thioredoxin domain-containing protein, partial [Desulfobulbaceae bacterium]|nr:thioredoxin domain-containing protein [Desulfobulbaceae bacterium]